MAKKTSKKESTELRKKRSGGCATFESVTPNNLPPQAQIYLTLDQAMRMHFALLAVIQDLNRLNFNDPECRNQRVRIETGFQPDGSGGSFRFFVWEKKK